MKAISNGLVILPDSRGDFQVRRNMAVLFDKEIKAVLPQNKLAAMKVDEVIDAAKAVSERMPREHRCTSLGGLAVTPTSLAIEQRLATLKKGSCAGCGCG